MKVGRRGGRRGGKPSGGGMNFGGPMGGRKGGRPPGMREGIYPGGMPNFGGGMPGFGGGGGNQQIQPYPGMPQQPGMKPGASPQQEFDWAGNGFNTPQDGMMYGQAIGHYRNPTTGETVMAPHGGYSPKEGSGWESYDPNPSYNNGVKIPGEDGFGNPVEDRFGPGSTSDPNSDTFTSPSQPAVEPPGEFPVMDKPPTDPGGFSKPPGYDPTTGSHQEGYDPSKPNGGIMPGTESWVGGEAPPGYFDENGSGPTHSFTSPSQPAPVPGNNTRPMPGFGPNGPRPDVNPPVSRPDPGPRPAPGGNYPGGPGRPNPGGPPGSSTYPIPVNRPGNNMPGGPTPTRPPTRPGEGGAGTPPPRTPARGGQGTVKPPRRGGNRPKPTRKGSNFKEDYMRRRSSR